MSRIAQSEDRPEREIVKQLLIVGLHNMYVDGLWIQKDNLNKPKHFQDLLELIAKDTGIPIALEGGISSAPLFITQMQKGMLDILARAPSADELPEYIRLAAVIAEKKLKALRENAIPLEDLLIIQKLSRKLYD